jgi:hypothetical protein
LHWLLLIICPHPRIPRANYKKGAAAVFLSCARRPLFCYSRKREKSGKSPSRRRRGKDGAAAAAFAYNSWEQCCRQGGPHPASSGCLQIKEILAAGNVDGMHTAVLCAPQIAQAPRARPGAICHSALCCVNTENRCLRTKAQISAQL